MLLPMDINQEKIIFTNGDSFTFGDELERPYSECWPAKLGEITKLQVVNFARSGAANNRIVETTKNFFNDLSRLSLVHTIGRAGKGMTSLGSATKIECAVIQWTSYIRLGPNETVPRDIVYREKEEAYLLDKYFVQVAEMQDFLDSRRIPYLMFNAFDNEKAIPQSNSKFKELVDDKYFIGWPDEAIVNWVYGLPHGPNGHPLEEAHIRIAEILHDNIRTKLRVS